ncbi:hypothetical protein L1887_38502 [Cichorium endivia]|nr:hypothetical protein L1887_38502 [Cichorium endivia]
MFVENDGRRSTSVFLIEHTLCFISLILIAATYLHLAAIIHDHLTHPTSTKLEADLNFPDGINASAYSGWLLVRIKKSLAINILISPVTLIPIFSQSNETVSIELVMTAARWLNAYQNDD